MLKRLFLPMILVLSLTACATKEYDWVVKISDREISPESYVSAQMHAYVEARNMADYSTSVLTGDIDGTSTDQWINDHTIEWLKRNIFIETEFEKRNLKFGAEADEFIRIFAQEGWENVAQMYEKNGLDFEYYFEYYRITRKNK